MSRPNLNKILPATSPLNRNLLNHSLRFTIALFAIVAYFGSALTSYAESKSTPITIEADRAMLNEKKGISTYTGNVLLTQDDISFAADEIRVHSVDGKLSKVVATGSPVNFKQASRGDKSITAKASVVEFYAKTKKVLLLNNASLSQGSNKFAGDRIEYNITTDTVTAGSTTETPQRVKVTIDPKNPITVTPSNQPSK